MTRALILMAAWWVLGAGLLTGQQPVVTVRQQVAIGSEASAVLRKINGRWWTPDNRLVFPPGRGGLVWEVSSKPGVVEFYHHRPFDTRRAEQLRLYLSPDEVEASFGKPNRRFPMESARGGMWYYHGVDGTILRLWFLPKFGKPGEEELVEAEYSYPDRPSQPVAVIAQALKKRDAERQAANRESDLAMQELRAKYSQRVPSKQSAAKAVAAVEMRNAAAVPEPVAKRFLPKESIDGIVVGMSREEVIGKLGEPTYRSGIAGGDGYLETLDYFTDANTQVSLQLLNGKVKRVR